MRLAVVTNILAPYRIPLFEELARRCDDFQVLLLAARHANRDWIAPPVRFATRTLPGLRFSRANAVDPIHINMGAWRTLRDFRPDVVLGGGFTPAHAVSQLYCRWHGIHYVPWGELVLQHPSESSALRRWLRRRMIGGSRMCVASSAATRDAFVHYGADAANILVSPMPVGNAAFRAAAARARESGASACIQREFGAPLVFSVGRLVDSKGWPQLLRSFQLMSREFPRAQLVIAGEGAQRAQYLALTHTLGLDSRVHFAGQLDSQRLVEFYAAADVFAFATLNDPYGAVLAEAMACDTVAVSSPHAAATAEMIVHGETGFIADPRDESSFAATLAQALRLAPEGRAALLARARLRMPDDDMQASASAIADFLASRLAGGRRKDSLLAEPRCQE
jgi:glycosyltransferase involved in cell wall biosynthesis